MYMYLAQIKLNGNFIIIVLCFQFLLLILPKTSFIYKTYQVYSLVTLHSHLDSLRRTYPLLPEPLF